MPGLYRDTLPAWSDTNLLSLCRVIQSRLFLVHVRAAIVGDTSRNNGHTFTYGVWSFAHNGMLAGFSRRRREYEALLPDEYYLHRVGMTDSEVLFLLLLSNGLETDPETAIRTALSQVAHTGAGAENPSRLAYILSNGHDVRAVRRSSDNKFSSL